MSTYLVSTYSNFPPCGYFFLECPFPFRFSLVRHLGCGFVDNLLQSHGSVGLREMVKFSQFLCCFITLVFHFVNVICFSLCRSRREWISPMILWSWSREKSMEFLSIVIQTLTRKHDIVMDWQCGTGFSLPSYTLSLSFISCFCIFNFFSLPHSISFHLGASITACCMDERHIVALERDSEIFEAIMLPMRDSVHTSGRTRCRTSGPLFY